MFKDSVRSMPALSYKSCMDQKQKGEMHGVKHRPSFLLTAIDILLRQGVGARTE